MEGGREEEGFCEGKSGERERERERASGASLILPNMGCTQQVFGATLGVCTLSSPFFTPLLF